MNFFKDYFENKRQNLLLIEEALSKREIEKKTAAETEKIDKEQKEEDIRNEKLRMESPVPWFELIGAKYDIEIPPLEPVTQRYRWNSAFIKHLREEGYTGQHDHEVIAVWEKNVAEKKAARIAEIQKEERRKSPEPWVEITGECYDEDLKQVSVILDWNPAFIKMLRSNGYQGASEQEMIDKWFKRLSEDIAGELHGTKYDG